jgi:hypothetical protein
MGPLNGHVWVVTKKRRKKKSEEDLGPIAAAQIARL